MNSVRMTTAIRIGLIGDYNEAVPAHQAIPRALDLAGEAAAALFPAGARSFDETNASPRDRFRPGNRSRVAALRPLPP
jgi:hypothetical protein